MPENISFSGFFIVMIRFFDETKIENMFRSYVKQSLNLGNDIIEKMRIYVIRLDFRKSNHRIDKKHIKERDFYTVFCKVIHEDQHFKSTDAKIKVLIERILLDNSNMLFYPGNSILEENVKYKVVF